MFYGKFKGMMYSSIEMVQRWTLAVLQNSRSKSNFETLSIVFGFKQKCLLLLCFCYPLCRYLINIFRAAVQNRTLIAYKSGLSGNRFVIRPGLGNNTSSSFQIDIINTVQIRRNFLENSPSEAGATLLRGYYLALIT